MKSSCKNNVCDNVFLNTLSFMIVKSLGLVFFGAGQLAFKFYSHVRILSKWEFQHFQHRSRAVDVVDDEILLLPTSRGGVWLGKCIILKFENPQKLFIIWEY